MVVANKASSPNAVATSSHSVSNNTANFAVLIETATTQADETVASEQNASNLEMKSDRGRLPTSSPVVDGANPSQQPSTLSLLDSEPATIAPEYAPVLDAPLGEATVINANSSPDNIAVDNAAVDNAARDDSPAASGSVKELLTDVVAKVVPATGAVISAGLSGDYEAIDLAMSQLLHDLDTVRTDATLLLDESTLRGLASAAMLGVIAAEIVRRRRVGKERLHQATFEEHLTIWMYPECSGVSGGPSR